MKLPRAVKRQDLYYVAVLLVATMLIWCAAYNRWTAEAWRTPTTYGGDAWWGMAVAKAIATGEVLPVLPKQPESLGAPFVANWNDYPSVEEGLNAWWGLLARSFRILVGSNIALLAAHLFAALTFYLVCRRLRYERSFSAAGALLFAFSPYALWRGLPHLGLTYCWHLPLGILVVWWCLAKAPLMRSRRKLGLSIAVAVVFGMQNPYYTGILLQFLFLASLCQLVRRASWRQVLAPIVVVGSFAVVTFLLMNVDTFFWRSTGAASGGAVARSYQHLEVYALKPIELIVPKQHRLETLARWTEEHYFTKAALLGEAGAAYLGVVALGAFAWLVWVAFERLAKRTAAPVPSHLLFIVWVCAYSVVGGINGIVGFALELFRGTNRYSIVILLLLLLFLVRELSRLARRWRPAARVALALGLAVVGLLDQVPPIPSKPAIAATRQRVRDDAQVVETLESKLPPRAMVFQMPVADFPEIPPIHRMGPYDHFRPYLHSRSLRFSFGNNKGSGRDAWQHDAEQMDAASLVQLLERYGFAAIWINRKGYADDAASLVASLRNAGRADVLAQSADLVCIRLDPATRPALPPVFPPPWYNLEGTAQHNRRWSAGDATVVLFNQEPSAKPARVTFAIDVLGTRQVEISTPVNQIVFARKLSSGSLASVAIDLNLTPGENVISFRTDRLGELPGNGDPRPLAFNIQDFAVSY